jgi:hypothetical protein
VRLKESLKNLNKVKMEIRILKKMMMRKMKNVMKMATESKKLDRFSKYYKGSYYGKSASFVFYQLVT